MLSVSLQNDIVTTVTWALCEDLGVNTYQELASSTDITAQLIPENKQAKARIISRDSCIVCGKPWVNEVFKQLDDIYNTTTKIKWFVNDGDQVSENDTLFELSGNARILLTGERTALNFLQSLSGTATITQTYVNGLKNSSTKLLDTRKTLPGLRSAQKYAVKCGGGVNHRMGLFDAFLIKENHIAACGGIVNAIKTARINHPDKIVEIEVENIEELTIALNAEADIIMLDNFTTEMITHSIALRSKILSSKTKFEVSGNMSLATLADFAKTGVDFISVGALTKHVQAVDLSMRFI